MSEKGVAVATIDTLLPEGIGLMKSQRGKKYSGSVTDIAKQLEVSKNKAVHNTPSGMVMVWKKGMAHHYDNPMQHTNLTTKDVAQLKYIYSKWFDIGTCQVDVLDDLLKDWMGFVSFVVKDAGLSTWPNSPNIGFLVKYCNQAMTWYNKGDEEQEVLQAIAKKSAGKILFKSGMKKGGEVPAVQSKVADEEESWTEDELMDVFGVGGKGNGNS